MTTKTSVNRHTRIVVKQWEINIDGWMKEERRASNEWTSKRTHRKWSQMTKKRAGWREEEEEAICKCSKRDVVYQSMKSSSRAWRQISSNFQWAKVNMQWMLKGKKSNGTKTKTKTKRGWLSGRTNFSAMETSDGSLKKEEDEEEASHWRRSSSFQKVRVADTSWLCYTVTVVSLL